MDDTPPTDEVNELATAFRRYLDLESALSKLEVMQEELEQKADDTLAALSAATTELYEAAGDSLLIRHEGKIYQVYKPHGETPQVTEVELVDL